MNLAREGENDARPSVSSCARSGPEPRHAIIQLGVLCFRMERFKRQRRHVPATDGIPPESPDVFRGTSERYWSAAESYEQANSVLPKSARTEPGPRGSVLADRYPSPEKSRPATKKPRPPCARARPRRPDRRGPPPDSPSVHTTSETLQTASNISKSHSLSTAKQRHQQSLGK